MPSSASAFSAIPAMNSSRCGFLSWLIAGRGASGPDCWLRATLPASILPLSSHLSPPEHGCSAAAERPAPMNIPVYTKRLIPSVLAIGLIAAIYHPAAAAPPADKVLLAPHRAVYDLKLSKSHGGRAIQAVRGRI